MTALDQPDGKGKISIENGEQITVLFTYDNSGESWGVFEYRKDEAGEAVSAWVKMSELVKVYDGIDFFAEHESEITEIADDGVDRIHILKLRTEKRCISGHIPARERCSTITN